jgi:ribosome-binding factor A
MTNVPIVPAVPTPARRPNFRQKRLAATIQEILAPALLDAGQLSDELQGQSLIVTGVAVSPNLHDAKIFLQTSLITAQTADASSVEGMTAGAGTGTVGGAGTGARVPLKLLKKTTPQIRSYLANRLNLRLVPHLHFFEDYHWEQVTRIEELIEQLPKLSPSPEPTNPAQSDE